MTGYFFFLLVRACVQQKYENKVELNQTMTELRRSLSNDRLCPLPKSIDVLVRPLLSQIGDRRVLEIPSGFAFYVCLQCTIHAGSRTFSDGLLFEKHQEHAR